MSTNTIDLSVKIGDHMVTTYQHEGKTFIEGREGSEFALRVKNPHPHRVKAVLSLDGVNVVTGKPATGEPDEAGYILNGGETQTILGYRLDDSAVARFRFTKAEAGYAQADKGLKGTTGVIGCRVYREKVAPAPLVKEIHHHHDHWHDNWTYPWWSPPYYPSYPPVWFGDPVQPTYTCGGTSNAVQYTTLNCATSQATVAQNMQNAVSCDAGIGGSIDGGQLRAMACSSDVVQSSIEANPFELGATFGSKVESHVTSVSFEVDCLLGQVEIYFSTRAGLTALGVDLTRTPKVAFPKAFSGDFCSPPKGWQG